jgi:pilus assembly protein CpaD
MTRNLALAALLGCSLLTACGGTENRFVESVHQPVVSRTDYVYDLAAPGSELSGDQAAGLTGWFDSLGLKYGDRVAVDTQGYGPGPRDAVGSVVARYGLLLDPTAPVTQGEVRPGSVRVVVSRMSATVPGCPDWSRKAAPNWGGESMSNYGCASNGNLAAMVADPTDLISGRETDSVVDATMSTKAIGTYRKAVNTGAGGLKVETTKGR